MMVKLKHNYFVAFLMVGLMLFSEVDVNAQIITTNHAEIILGERNSDLNSSDIILKDLLYLIEKEGVKFSLNLLIKLHPELVIEDKGENKIDYDVLGPIVKNAFLIRQEIINKNNGLIESGKKKREHLNSEYNEKSKWNRKMNDKELENYPAKGKVYLNRGVT